MEKSNEIREATDLGTFLGQIARQISLRGEMLRGISNQMGEYDSIEGAQIFRQLGVELDRIGQQLNLLEDHLCNGCQLKVVTEIISISPRSEGK